MHFFFLLMFILALNYILPIWTLLYFEFLLTISEICILSTVCAKVVLLIVHVVLMLVV